ncbi:MAG: bacteriohemerythrin [Pseudomonadota bacterium]|uniref:bacteriohemerythrin n=1 Tax=Alcanivorax sp. TaxID=1872427 RepID=UPI0025BC9CEB|nr:bacteriohemerythrin [Alcanivorax sp.]MED5239803.1 bacteriohemerythrin [Pseudomonadota bacterium]MEE3319813.1 bacteriohemerythrin [Pseudomonadota bacterium]
MRIVWGPQYELDILVIDQQHKRIVEFINTLDTLVGKPDAYLGVARILYDLVDYTESHFSFEEALMERAGYKELDDHHQVHRQFTQRIESLLRSTEKGEDVAEALLQLLEKWLLHHILEEDRAYADEVREFINSIGQERLGGWVNDNVRKHFRVS